MTAARMTALSDAGVSIWLDDLSRELLDSGTLAERMTEYGVVGVTSNPAIFQAAISDSAAYDNALRAAVAENAELESVLTALTTADVRDACDLLAGTYAASRGEDGRVSLEVDPRLARDTAGTIAQAGELAAAVGRGNVMIKIPATAEGLPAISEVLGQGIDVNVTLIFSVEQYRAVTEAYVSGLECARDSGLDLGGMHSVASVFVSRLDTEIDSRLDADSPLRGLAGLANARLCQEVYDEVFERGERFAALASKGARPQRLLWASTGVKEPAYPDTLYVSGLVTRGCVNTMPFATMQAFADHGEVEGDTVRGTAAQSHATMSAIAEAGIDLPEVFALLESQGVEKFVSAWEALLAAVHARIQHATS